FPDGVPENYDFGSDSRIFEAVARSLPTTQGAAKYLGDPKAVVDCVGEQVRQSELAHACLVALNNTRKCCEEFGNRHPWAKEYFEKAVAAGGYLVDAAAIISSWAGGPATGIPVTAVVLASRSEPGEAVANGILDVLSNAAKACARTDQEEQEFVDTARFCVQTAGAANIVSSINKFTRHSPRPKNRRTPTESIAIRETELAGTGLRVKVPVEERVPSVSRKMESQGAGEALRTSGTGKKLPKLTELESKIIAEANGIFNSKEIDLLRTAHMENKPLTVKINGRLVQYEPELPYSGLTMFGENGFLMGKEAFSSIPELKKTLLHELHRLHTSKLSAGVNAHLVVIETDSAFNFAEKYFKDIK
ncbi:MAG: hypothetical protein LBB17_01865, partial [Puniceicoccales bacterium]|nr:hypothetical protein [Puniceicoccales bacterium]